MSPQQLEGRRKNLREAFQRTIDYAIEKGVHIFLQAGDLFDMPDPRNAELVFVASQFKKLYDHNIRVFLIGGTHDAPKISILAEAIPQSIFHEVGHIHLFSSRTNLEPQRVNLEGVDISISGLSTNHQLTAQDDPLADLNFPAQADISILMLHYSVEGHFLNTSTEPRLSLSSIANLSHVDYIFLGHLHKNDNFSVGGKRIIIAGSTERMDFGEISNPTGFYYLEMDKNGIDNLEYVPLTSQPMGQMEINAADIGGLEPTDSILNKVKAVSFPEQLLKCKFSGVVKRDIFHQIKFRDIWMEGNNGNFYFDLDTSELRIGGESQMAYSGVGFSQKEEIDQVAGVLTGRATEPEEKEIIQEARNLILSRY